jgi:SAM-dependent methyltransferase
MSLIGTLHQNCVHSRRVRVLAREISSLLPRDVSVLDVGCGDGLLASRIAGARRDVQMQGIDVLQRPQTEIPVTPFDGCHIPHPEASFDVVLFVDVLHHTDDPMILLREARRVARRAIVIKDHTLTGAFAFNTLRFMDRIGNKHHGVALPYNYWTPEQWRAAVRELGVSATVWRKDLRLYPTPARWLFERSLHFLALLSIP